MNGVLGHNSALVRLYWAGDNLGYSMTDRIMQINPSFMFPNVIFFVCILMLNCYEIYKERNEQ